MIELRVLGWRGVEVEMAAEAVHSRVGRYITKSVEQNVLKISLW